MEGDINRYMRRRLMSSEMSNKRKPIENHKTAAWANIDKKKKNSCVSIPSEDEVKNAKEYVDENRK